MIEILSRIKTFALKKNPLPGSVYIGLLVVALAIIGSVVTADPAPPRPDGIALIEPVIVEQSISAFIKLKVPQFEQGNWAVVQWLGADGIWNDVQGWQGNFWGDGTMLWWVYKENLGQRNFRWIVYQDSSRVSVTQVSRTFNLPSDPHGGVYIDMTHAGWVAWSKY